MIFVVTPLGTAPEIPGYKHIHVDLNAGCGTNTPFIWPYVAFDPKVSSDSKGAEAIADTKIPDLKVAFQAKN